MVRRRGRYYPLKHHTGESWCVVCDRTTRVVGWTHYPPGTDLEQLFAQITKLVTNAGWTVEDHISWMGSFFCHRIGTNARLQVQVQPTPPSNPLAEWQLPPVSLSLEDCFLPQAHR